MAELPGGTGTEKLGILIESAANNAGIDSAKTGLAGLEAEAKTAGAAGAAAGTKFGGFNKGLQQLGTQATAVGRSLTTSVTLPIVAIGAASAKMAMDFQQSMELLHTNAGIPQAQIEGLSTKILNLAGAVGQSPNSLAQAMFHVATVGAGLWTTAKELDVLRIAAQGAAIGQANLDDTTYALTSTLSANVKGAQDATQAMGTLLATVQSGDMHLSDLNEVIGTGLMGTLATFGVSLRSVGAALATLGDNGEKGAAAGTRLRMMLTLMASPSQAAAKILGDLGLTTDQTSSSLGQMNQIFAETGLSTTKLADDLRQPNGITVALKDLRDHLEKAGFSASQTDAVLSKAFGGGRTDAALLQLLNNIDRMDIKYQQIGTDSSNFANNWADQQQTMKQQWDNAWSGIQANMIKLGEAIMPQVAHAMHDVGQAVGRVANWFDHLSNGQKQFVIDTAGVIALAGPLLMIFGKLATSISAIIKLGGTIRTALGIGGLASGAAEGTAAIAGEGGLLAALTGPVGLTAALVGLTGLGVYEWFRHFKNAGDEASTSMGGYWSDTASHYAGTVSMLTLLQDNQSGAQKKVKDTLQSITDLQKRSTPLQQDAAKKTQAVADAQDAVNRALKNYGSGSPQYQQATHDLAQKQWDLDKALSNEANNNLTLMGQEGVLRDARNKLASATSALAGYQDYLNGKIGTTVALLGSSLPQAINLQAIPAVNRLQGSTQVLQQNVGRILQMSGSLSGLSSSSVYLQGAHATGTNYARGGWSLVGEQGPELINLPRGSQVKTAPQTGASGGGGGTTTVTIGTVVLRTQEAAQEFFRQLNQDIMNLGKGLTANQGVSI